MSSIDSRYEEHSDIADIAESRSSTPLPSRPGTPWPSGTSVLSTAALSTPLPDPRSLTEPRPPALAGEALPAVRFASTCVGGLQLSGDAARS